MHRNLISGLSSNGLVIHWGLIKRNGFASLDLEVCSSSRNVGVRMNQLIEFLERHGYWVLFASVAGRQACLPLPANLLLLAAGALAGQRRLNPVAILACSVAAFILADLAWYEAGRRWGTKTLHFFCRASQDPHSCVETLVKNFSNRAPKSLLISKFVFGLDAVASPLSGICGISWSQFLVFDGLGALAWSSAYMIAGYEFHNQLDRIAADSRRMGEILGFAAIAALGCVLALRLFRWYRFLHEFRLARISPEELNDKLKTGDQILLLDLQGSDKPTSEALAIPGAIRMDPRRLECYIKRYRGVDLRTDREVILYGASSKDSTSARVALALRRRGFEKVRPLSGGLPAWLNRGYPAIRNPPMLSDTEHEVFALREVLLHSQMQVARLLNRSAADIDRILKHVKERIQNSHDANLPLLKKSDIEKPAKIAQDLLGTPTYGQASAPD
jgi:membrane protein DedA with SNARE-associated domain/rhodanese-related sulfurtransferase